MRLSKTLAVLASCVLLMGAGSAFGNLIKNGDFEAGGTGFGTDYDYVLSNTGPGEVTVTSDANDWGGYANPSPASQMLVADGSTNTAGDRVWYQEVDLVAGNTYTASFDAVSLDSDSGNEYAELGLYVRKNAFSSELLASVSFSSDNVVVGSTEDGSYTPSSDGTYEFFIGDLNFSEAGNAFAVDNITVVPEPSSLALLGIGSLVGFGIYTRRRKRS